MKQLAGLVLMVAALLSIPAHSAPTSVSPQISAVITNPKFTEAVAAATQVSRFETIVVGTMDSHVTSGTEIVNIELWGVSLTGQMHLIGSVVAFLRVEKNGTYSVASLYFKPLAEPPPGGGVINFLNRRTRFGCYAADANPILYTGYCLFSIAEAKRSALEACRNASDLPTSCKVSSCSECD